MIKNDGMGIKITRTQHVLGLKSNTKREGKLTSVLKAQRHKKVSEVMMEYDIDFEL